MLRFDRRRWRAFALILGSIYALAFLGTWLATLPGVGAFLFLGALALWFLPAVALSWTGLFEFHEFGGVPNGVLGHLAMLAFYVVVAVIASWPFRPRG